MIISSGELKDAIQAIQKQVDSNCLNEKVNVELSTREWIGLLGLLKCDLDSYPPFGQKNTKQKSFSYYE